MRWQAFVLCCTLVIAGLPCAPAYAAAKAPVNDPSVSKQYYLDSVHARNAWSYVPYGAPVTVAVIDTGVNAAHPDLASAVTGGYDAANTAAGGAARARTDADGHGTHMAGIIGAVTDNGIGIAGASFSARIMPVNVDKRDGSGTPITSDTITRAYEYLLSKATADANGNGKLQTVAREYNVRVVNLSIGSEWNDDTDSADYKQDAACLAAIKKADAAGILTVCSAGNKLDGVVLPYRAWPADNATCLGVAALTKTNKIAAGSNYGSGFVCAPGAGLLTTKTGGGYTTVSGTSGAAALVSGVAAAMFAANPALTPAKARNALRSTATDLGALGRDDVFGYGKINALAAVKKVAAKVKKGRRVVRSGIVYKVTSVKTSKRKVAVVGVTNKKAVSLSVPATVTVNGAAFKVASIGKKAFKGCKKLKKLTLKTKLLKKASVKKCLAGSKIKTIKAPKAVRAAYRTIFTKANVGRSVRVK